MTNEEQEKLKAVANDYRGAPDLSGGEMNSEHESEVSGMRRSAKTGSPPEAERAAQTEPGHEEAREAAAESEDDGEQP